MYLLKSGFVHDSWNNTDTNGQYYILRAHIHHLMKVQRPWNAEVYITNISGYVKSGKCDCSLALGAFCFCFVFGTRSIT